MYLSVFANIVKVSEDLKKLTKISRADSPNGAIAHNIEEAVIQVRNVDLIHIKEEDSTLEGLGQTLKNGLVDVRDSKSKMKATFMKSRVPRLQAFHSLGIELALKMVGKYFVQTNRWMQEKTLELFNQSPKGVLSAKQLKTFYQALTMYYLTSTATFGNDGKHTFEEKRDWYIYEFPKYFVNLRNENPELNKNSVIQKLEIESGKILMKRAGKLTPTQRQMLGNAITSLLHKGDDIHLKLAADLMLYAFYTTGLNFGPDNYGMFFNVDFYNQFPEFTDALRRMEFFVNEHANNSIMKNFMDQFYAIHGTYFTLNLQSPSAPNTIPDAKLQFDRKTVANKNEKGKAYKYVTVNYTLEKTEEIVKIIVNVPCTPLLFNIFVQNKLLNVSTLLKDINQKNIEKIKIHKFFLSSLLKGLSSSTFSIVSDNSSPNFKSSFISSNNLFSLIFKANTTITINITKAVIINGTNAIFPASFIVVLSLILNIIPNNAATIAPKYPTRLIIPFALLLNGFGVKSGIKATAGER